MKYASVQQASYLDGGSMMWMLPLYLYINQKSDDDDDDDDDEWSEPTCKVLQLVDFI